MMDSNVIKKNQLIFKFIKYLLLEVKIFIKDY